MITVHIPGALRVFTDGHSEVTLQANGGTLLDALQVLFNAYPGLRDRVITEQGQIREHINIFVGNEHIRYTGGLATPISAGNEISIVPAISGGGGMVGREMLVSRLAVNESPDECYPE